MHFFFLAILMSVPVAKSEVLVIGHRGACGYLPEHTMEGYRKAIELGADFIEPDLVSTKDGVLIARHENNIAETTDVSTKFPERKTTKKIDGQSVEGWFTEDFTLAEIKTLRAKERLAFRDHSHDFQFEIPTFDEILALAKAADVGVYPETKHPTYFRSIGLELEPKLVAQIKKANLDSADAKIIIQSFELSSLRELKQMTKARLVFLIDEANLRPYDHVVSGDPRTYGDLIRADSLKSLQPLLYGIGPWKRLIIPEVDGKLQAPTSLIQDAHAAGLKVHAYTFRSDSDFLNAAYQGDPAKEYRQFYDLGLDGVFSDFADHAVHAR